MSGGVDSSVAALLLLEKGFDVIGLTMQLVPCGAEKNSGCCGLAAVNSAQKVCQKLNIPHYVLNFRQPFQKKVIDYFCREYQAGRTPNPCVVCNQFIKFDLLLRRAREIGADYLATGHYARLRREILNPKSEIQNIKLLKGKDKEKDQSYFLYRLTQNQLKYVLFPLGDLTKKQVRQIAKKANLPAAERPESQEICFIPDNDYRKFITQIYADKTPHRNFRFDTGQARTNAEKTMKPGFILDKNGKILGQHQGITFYTIGQRKGLGIAGQKPVYVLKIDKNKNALIVGAEKGLYQKELLVKNLNWIRNKTPKLPLKAMAKIRYRQLMSAVSVYSESKNKMRVRFTKPQRAITPGQSIVFYKGNEVLSGGIIV